MIKILKKIIVFVGSLVLLLLIMFLVVFRKELKVAFSLKKVDGSESLFVMDYDLQYNIDDITRNKVRDVDSFFRYFTNFLSHGLIAKNVEGNRKRSFACTSFQVSDDKGISYFGRNFDASDSGCVILYNNQKNAYKSINLCSLEYLGIDYKNIGSIKNKITCLALPFVAMDGMNEKGVAISILVLPQHPANNDTKKPDLYTSIIIRLVLDCASNVNEAISLLEKYDVFDEQVSIDDKNMKGSAYHYLISDSSGDSAVVEFDYNDGYKLIEVKKDLKKNYQIATNHYLCDKYLNEGSNEWQSIERYREAEKELENIDVSKENLMNVLNNVSMKNLCEPTYSKNYFSSTLWSALYNLNEKSVEVCENMNYDKKYFFQLDSEK